MAAIQNLISTVGKIDNAGFPITINQSDYSVAPQAGDQILVFANFTATKSLSYGFGGADIFGWNRAPGWVAILPNFQTYDDGTNFRGGFQVIGRTATGTSADNVTWFPTNADGCTSFQVCHIVFRNTMLREAINDAYTSGSTDNFATWCNYNEGNDTNQFGFGLTASTLCKTFNPLGGTPLATGYQFGQAAVTGTNLIVAFMGASSASSVTFSGMSSSLTTLYNSGNGMVIAGEYTDGTGSAVSGNRQLTWGSSRISMTASLTFTQTRIPPNVSSIAATRSASW